MTNKNTQKPQQLNAAQRLQGLEQSIYTLDQAIYNQVKQFDIAKEALSLLHDKVDALVTALSAGQTVSDELLNSLMEQKKVNEMKAKIQNLIDDGQLEKADEVTDVSFVVVRELDSSTGKVINPRLQFVTRVLNDESKSKILGKKAGDSIKFIEDNPAVIEIEEIYNVITQSETSDSEEVAETEPTTAAQVTETAAQELSDSAS